jgi:hypothetical protein
MSYKLNARGTLALKVGEDVVRVHFRRPEAGQVIETLVKKMPSGDEAADAQRILIANLELGRACVTGIGEGDLQSDGAPLVTDPDHPGYVNGWREIVAAHAPLLLIALGQYLTTTPTFLAEPALKKTSGTPGLSCAEK